MNGHDDVLLVMGSGRQHFREYMLRALAQQHRLWLFGTEAASWQRPYVAGSTVVDMFDPQAAVPAALELARRVPVAGVHCYHEGVIIAASHVATALGLPGPSPAATAAVRDKRVTRELLTKAGFRQPRYAVAASPQEAAQAAVVTGFPLVAKPRSLGSSEGVVKASSAAELDWAFGVSRSAGQAGMISYPEILLEEYLTGPEISVDAAVTGGEYLPFIIARKQLGAEPYFDETGHTVEATDPLFDDADLLQMLAKAHEVLGWNDGITHTEVKFTPDGPVIIEVNGRLGGDLIPYLGLLANGVDFARVATDLALGRRPDTTRTRQLAAAIRFLTPPVSCVTRRIQLPAIGDSNGLHLAVALAGPGERLLTPPDGYAADARHTYLIAQGSTAAECQQALDRAEPGVRLESDPLPVAQG